MPCEPPWNRMPSPGGTLRAGHPRSESKTTTGVCTVMRSFALVCTLFLLAGCNGPRTYLRSTLAPLSDAYSCGLNQLKELGYAVELDDPVGAVAQGRREITGLVETARGGAARAIGAVT